MIEPPIKESDRSQNRSQNTCDKRLEEVRLRRRAGSEVKVVEEELGRKREDGARAVNKESSDLAILVFRGSPE